MTDEHATDSNGLTRRQALAAAAALCGFGAIAATSTGVAQASGTLRVQLSQYPALKKVGGVALVESPTGTYIAVVRTGRTKYVALDRRCPHQGAIVGQRGREWVCPLHGSRFDIDGDKVSGITPTGLRTLRTSLNGGVLTISG